MRIVAGNLRHRQILMTNLETTRETQDKVRQAIYNMIGPYFDKGKCLDLFAGSGAMAFEAYSRGMEYIELNDLNKEAINICKLNAKNLGITDVKFYNLDYLDYIKQCKNKFDLIILDPPYKMDNIDFIMESIYPLVNDEGTVVFEMGINSKFNDKYYDLELIKNKEYGIKRVVVYRRFLNE